MNDPIVIRTGPYLTPEEMPTPEERFRSLKASWEERGKMIERLLAAKTLDLASVAILIDRSPNSVALSELRAIILEAVEDIKTIKKGLEVR